MTILELQKELQGIYDKYGNMNVCFETTFGIQYYPIYNVNKENGEVLFKI